LLQPKRVRYRKTHRAHIKGKAQSGNYVIFGDFGLQADAPGLISARQIEATRRVIVRLLGRDGRMWIRIFPDRAVTSHPAETRMGSGKGMVDHYSAAVKPGHILYEMAGVREDVAKKAIKLAGYKLPIATRFVARIQDGEGE
jgi:large subunit ribosomal protein L16